MSQSSQLLTPSGRAGKLLSDAHYRSKRKGLPAPTITKEWIAERIAAGRCAVTGIPFELHRDPYRRINSWSPSLDRLDPTGPYSPINTRLVCTGYNRARNDLGDAAFMTLAMAMLLRLKLEIPE